MSNLKKKCGEPLKDPAFKGRECNKKAKYMVKIKGEYCHRCGIHSEKKDRIDLYSKKEKNNGKKKKEEISVTNNLNFDDLLKYIENEEWKKEIPQVIKELFNDFDKLINTLIDNNTNNILINS